MPVILSEGLEYPVADFEVGVERFLKFLVVYRVPGIEGAGNLVDVVAYAPDMAENLPERLVVGRRTALGTRSGVTVQTSGPQEGGNG